MTVALGFGDSAVSSWRLGTREKIHPATRASLSGDIVLQADHLSGKGDLK